MMSLEKSILLVQSNDKKAPNYEELMKGGILWGYENLSNRK